MGKVANTSSLETCFQSSVSRTPFFCTCYQTELLQIPFSDFSLTISCVAAKLTLGTLWYRCNCGVMSSPDHQWAVNHNAQVNKLTPLLGGQSRLGWACDCGVPGPEVQQNSWERSSYGEGTKLLYYNSNKVKKNSKFGPQSWQDLSQHYLLSLQVAFQLIRLFCIFTVVSSFAYAASVLLYNNGV